MNKTLTVYLAILLFFTHSVVWATPPTDVKITYDKVNLKVHIEVEHISSNTKTHRIRHMIVFKNDKEVKEFNYAIQSTPQGFSEDLSIELKPGDVIKVKAVCSKNGFKEGVFSWNG